MQDLIEYIGRVNVSPGAKWMLAGMCLAPRAIFTQGSLQQLSGLNKREVGTCLCQLLKSRCVAWRANPEDNNEIHYWIVDHHLRHRVQAVKSKPFMNMN